MTNEPFVMRHGAFVMLDALGFRGIWKRHAPEAVVAQLGALAAAMQKEADRLAGPPGDWLSPLTFVKPVFLSDTIVFGLEMKPLDAINEKRATLGVTYDQHTLAAEAVRLAAHLAAVLQRRALVGTPALAYRGCISLGGFGMTDRFVIGEAVDEAAAFEKLPQGAFVVLGPSALDVPHLARDTGISPLMPYDVPLKGQKLLATRTVVPYELPDETEAAGGMPWDALIERLGSTFETDDPAQSDSVAEKKKNTLAFMSSVNPTERLTPEAFLLSIAQDYV
jgi:class 3 adenylate cyclase